MAVAAVRIAVSVIEIHERERPSGNRIGEQQCALNGRKLPPLEIAGKIDVDLGRKRCARAGQEPGFDMRAAAFDRESKRFSSVGAIGREIAIGLLQRLHDSFGIQQRLQVAA